MTRLAGIVVVASGLWLVALAAAIWIKPEHAERFLRSFASSARAHYTEQLLRLIAGLAMILFSPEMRHSRWFAALGWLLVVTAVLLLLVPWSWHHRFAQWAIPLAIRHRRWLALGSLAFGAFILFAAV